MKDISISYPKATIVAIAREMVIMKMGDFLSKNYRITSSINYITTLYQYNNPCTHSPNFIQQR
jgi:hypothetical protein